MKETIEQREYKALIDRIETCARVLNKKYNKWENNGIK